MIQNLLEDSDCGSLRHTQSTARWTTYIHGVLAEWGLDPPVGFVPGPVSGVRVGAFFLGVLSPDTETQQGFVPCREPTREDGAPPGPLSSALNAPGPRARGKAPWKGLAPGTRGACLMTAADHLAHTPPTHTSPWLSLLQWLWVVPLKFLR